MYNTPDGDYQTFRANDGDYDKEHFFGRDPRVAKMVEGWDSEKIHDWMKHSIKALLLKPQI